MLLIVILQLFRKPSGKKPDGQPGHKGFTLEQAENSDKIIEDILPSKFDLKGYSRHILLRVLMVILWKLIYTFFYLHIKN